MATIERQIKIAKKNLEKQNMSEPGWYEQRIADLEKENEMLRDILNQIEDLAWIYRHNNYPTKE